MSSELEPVSEFAPYVPGESWESLMAEADTVLGYDLAKDELADELTGVPFLVTRMQFRAGVNRPTGERDAATGKPIVKQGAYVTLSCVLADSFNLTRINVARKASHLGQLLTLEALPFSPGDLVVLNDGSTGLYRQSVEYLHAKDFIVLPDPLVTVGPMGQCSYDLIPNEWESINTGYSKYDEDEFLTYDINVRLFAKRGLRLSDYENEFTAPGEQARTRYFG
jgi:hypothetical protein